jgi:sugar phosphate isomerase/epimerase
VIRGAETRRRRRRALTAVAALLGAVLAATGCGDDGESTGQRLDDVKPALRAAGLEICEGPESGRVSEDAERERAFVVAIACGDVDDEAVVELIAWSDDDARDAAARRFVVPTHPHTRNHGAVWELGLVTVTVSGERDDAVVDRVADAMDDLGAS